MDNKKVTKKEMFGRLIEIVEEANAEDVEELVEFLNHEIELISKKRSGQTQIQKENEKLVEIVYDTIAKADERITISEIFDAVKNDEIKSSQKVSALVKKLVDAGRVIKIKEKRITYYMAATDDNLVTE